MSVDRSENKIYAYLIFLIWPFLSIGLAILNYRSSWAKNIIWFFVAYFGFTMVTNDSIDSSRYKDQFVQQAKVNDDKGQIYMYKENESSSVDFLQPGINLILSKFTSNYKVLFAVYGLIFGFFYSRNIWLLLKWIEHPLAFTGIILLTTFILINPFWNMNGFRYYTAAQVFIYGVLLYFVESKRIGIYFMISTFTIHFSFLIAIAIFLIYFFLGNRVTVFFYFFVASLFIEGLQLEQVRDNLIYLPEILQDRTSSYVNEEYAESIGQFKESANWYVQGHLDALHYVISSLLIVIFWKGRNFLKNETNLYKYFGFILLFYAFANIMSSIPSAGRFLNPASSMAVSLFFLLGAIYSFNFFWIRYLMKITRLLLILFIIVAIRIGFDTIGISTVLGNPILAAFMENDSSLINFLK